MTRSTMRCALKISLTRSARIHRRKRSSRKRMSHLDQYLHNGELGSVLLIDKPVGLTSFDVIYRLRRWHGVVKAGHAGTLDPLASGLLIICMGKETKNLHRFSNLDKEYV